MDILVALYKLKELAEVGEVPLQRYGICGNLDYLVGVSFPAYEFVSANSSDWDHSNGNPVNPIPVYRGMPWKGVAKKARMSLLNHLIEKVESGEAVFEYESSIPFREEFLLEHDFGSGWLDGVEE